LPIVVPAVVSLTVIPTISPAVNMLFTRRWPNSVCAAKCASRCKGCTFSVRALNNVLSISVTVRDQGWSNSWPMENSS